MAFTLADALVMIGADDTPLGKKLGEAENRTRGWVTSLGGKLTKAVGGALAVGVGSVTALGVGIVKLAADAAPVAGITRAFEALTSEMEGGSAAMLAALKESSNGLISNTALMRAYNEAAQLVGRDFAERLPDAFTYLSKVSASTGADMDFLLDSLVKGVGRLSPMILDNLGIQVSLSEAYAAYAAEIGKSTDELDKSEQQTALMNAAMSKLAENTEGMAGRAGVMSRFAVMLTDVRDAIGTRLVPVLAPLTGKIIELANFAFPYVTAATERFADILMVGGEWLLKGAHAVQVFFVALAGGIDPLTALENALLAAFGPDITNAVMSVVARVQGFIDRAREVIAPVAAFVAQFVSAQDVLTAFGIVVGAIVVKALLAVVAVAAPVVAAAAGLIAIVALLRNAWENDWGGIQGKTAAALAAIRSGIQAGLSWILDFWSQHGEAILATAQRIWELIQTTIQNALRLVRSIFEAWRALFAGDWELFGYKLMEVWINAWLLIRDFLTGFWDLIKPVLETLWTSIKTWWEGIDWANLGQTIVDGVIAGAGALGQRLIDALSGAAAGAWQAWNEFWGSRSPSRLMRNSVQNDIMGAAVLGIQASRQELAAEMAGAGAAAFAAWNGAAHGGNRFSSADQFHFDIRNARDAELAARLAANARRRQLRDFMKR